MWRVALMVLGKVFVLTSLPQISTSLRRISPVFAPFDSSHLCASIAIRLCLPSSFPRGDMSPPGSTCRFVRISAVRISVSFSPIYPVFAPLCLSRSAESIDTRLWLASSFPRRDIPSPGLELLLVELPSYTNSVSSAPISLRLVPL